MKSVLIVPLKNVALKPLNVYAYNEYCKMKYELNCKLSRV